MDDRQLVPRSLVVAGVLLLVVLAVGTAGYVGLENWSGFDALYMTVTTITTIGGGEPRPLDLAGKWWTMIVVAIGFGVLTYTLLALIGFVIEGRLGEAVERRQMRLRVRRMRDHFVLCGFGRVGREIALALRTEKIPLVVIDSDEPSLERAKADGFVVVHGNAADVATLREAAIDTSRGLITAVDSDADNVYVTLSARVLRPDLFIVARANAADAEPKLRLAGANRIVSPYTLAGRRLASLAMRPSAVEFVDTVLSTENDQLMLEDFHLGANSPWIGKRLGDLVPADGGLIVLALKHEGHMQFRPGGDALLSAHDAVVVAGPTEAIRTVEARF
ncbi:MAG TPA: NAD-binding protein [Candidatus Sulfotelmatobacter sp.]|nr:NAD-binding protein [Candidatus Sulfotelmatobacter sp.]